MKISTHSLGWQAANKHIVKDVSLQIAGGETFGLIGPNGSGKSTLLRLMAGILHKPQGMVCLDDKPLKDFSRRDIAKRVAFVEQFADTAEALTVNDVVELGRTPWLSLLTPFSAQDSKIVNESLQAVSMQSQANQRWATLSGGERQRVHIAKALAQRPQVLLLDEPTNHLDIHHQLMLLRLVSQIEVTVVMAVHDLNQATRCDRLGVMDNGELVACGKPSEVLSPDILASVFQVQGTPLQDPSDNATVFRFHSLDEN